MTWQERGLPENDMTIWFDYLALKSYTAVADLYDVHESSVRKRIKKIIARMEDENR